MITRAHNHTKPWLSLCVVAVPAKSSRPLREILHAELGGVSFWGLVYIMYA